MCVNIIIVFDTDFWAHDIWVHDFSAYRTSRHADIHLVPCLWKLVMSGNPASFTRMVKCIRFKVFNVTLLFGLLNLLIFGFFAFLDVTPFYLIPMSKPMTASKSGNVPNTEGIGLVNEAFPYRDRHQIFGQDNGVQNVKGSEDNRNDKQVSAIKLSKVPQQHFPSNQDMSESVMAIDSDSKEANSNLLISEDVIGKLPQTPKHPPSSNLGPPKHKASQKVNETPAKASGRSDVSLPLCPLLPPKLVGPLATYKKTLSFDKIAKLNPLLKRGGRYKPLECLSRHRVAIVIPYRNREQHLKILLHNLHPMLQRQQLDYGIYVIEEELPTRFNRAMLMNIGFVEALKRYDYQCAVFHDVDLIPENDRNIYSCPQMPRHLSAAIDKFKYR